MSFFDKKAKKRIAYKAKRLYGDRKQSQVEDQIRRRAENIRRQGLSVGRKLYNTQIAPKFHGVSPQEYGRAYLKNKTQNLLTGSKSRIRHEAKVLLREKDTPRRKRL